MTNCIQDVEQGHAYEQRCQGAVVLDRSRGLVVVGQQVSLDVVLVGVATAADAGKALAGALDMGGGRVVNMVVGFR